MSYVRVPDPVLDVAKPGRSIDWKRIRDNQDDHEARILALEDPGIRVHSHFTETNFGSTDSINGIYHNAGTSAGGSASWQYRMEVATDEHAVRLTANLGLTESGGGKIAGIHGFHFTNRPKPLTFSCRAKMGSNALNTALRIGFVGEGLPSNTATTRPNECVMLELGTSTNWRFTSSTGGTPTVGSNNFARIANGTWFEVQVVFTDDPSDQALCYVDGVLKETITATLPTAKNLFGCASVVAFNTGGAVTLIDVDEFTVSCGGVVADMA